MATYIFSTKYIISQDSADELRAEIIEGIKQGVVLTRFARLDAVVCGEGETVVFKEEEAK